MSTEENPCILIVDDTPENIELLTGLLENDYNIKAAPNGNIALKAVKAGGVPDLILLDIMMPGMDGFEVCQKLKEDPETRDIPIIFITAKNEVDDETKGFELGAVDFISKPISPPIVEARVKAHINFKITNDKIRDLPKQLGRYLSPQIVQAIIDGKSEAKINTKRKNSQFSFQILLALHLQVNLWNLRI